MTSCGRYSSETKLQEFDCPAHRLDVVWATHALYVLPARELELGMRQYRGL